MQSVKHSVLKLTIKLKQTTIITSQSKRELLLARGDLAVVADVDEALGMELVEDLVGSVVLGFHPVVVRHLLLRLRVPSQLLLDVFLAQPSLFLFRLDLGLRTPPLGACLQHVGRGASLHCKRRQTIRREERRSTYETLLYSGGKHGGLQGPSRS